MRKKKIGNNKIPAAKGLDNKHLAAMIAVILIMACAITYTASASSKSKNNWLKIQAQNLGYALTGNTAGKSGETLAVPVIMYHHVGSLPEKPDAVRRDMTISTDNFELQVAWLKGQGYESISLGDLLQYAKGKSKLPEKPVIFTFDDGYGDTFENAVPTLAKYGYKGSFAVITQFPGITQGDNEYASWPKIKQAQKEGMEIISHTQDHFDGTNKKYDAAFIYRNLLESQKDLQANLGSSLPILAYPYGHYNASYIKLAKQAGFEMALTTNPGQKVKINDLMELPRIRVRGNENLEQFKKRINGF